MTRQEAVTKIIESGVIGDQDVFKKNKDEIEKCIRSDETLEPLEKHVMLYILDDKINLCIDAWSDMAQTLYISVERLKRIISALEDKGYVITGSLNLGKMRFRSINPRFIKKIIQN